MKKSLAAGLTVLSLLSLPFHASAADRDVQAPMPLTMSQMDAVTAGGRHAGRNGFFNPVSWHRAAAAGNRADVTQVNISPVTIVQIGNNNTAIVYSGNFSWIYQ